MSKTFDHGSARANAAAFKAVRQLKTYDLAEAAGIHKASMSRFMTGGASMPLDRFEAMLKTFGARLVIVADDAPEEAPE